jgi:undecaprenyl diphosphate synthase
MNIPNCIGIIMDGNRRWAKNQGLLALKGHEAGAETLKNIVRVGRDAGVKHMIFYTFSTENWKRTEEEVSYLLDLFVFFAEKEFEEFHKEGGVVHIVGDTARFPEKLQKVLLDIQEKSKNNPGPHIYLAMNYGGRAEILSAVKKIVSENPNNNLQPEQITEAYFAKHLQTGDMPDPDIIIRTSGEQRLSGFLPWQGVYSELFFTQTMWPDFSKEEFLKIMEEYAERDRRHGK